MSLTESEEARLAELMSRPFDERSEEENVEAVRLSAVKQGLYLRETLGLPSILWFA